MMALVLMDHALLHRAQNADVRTPTPRIAGAAQPARSQDKRKPVTKTNPEPTEA
jgi:chorismate synthase